jgi:S-adenosylmethionine:tRNA ribosyltransferase-isomerase
MKLADFDYELPEALIAQRPVEPRTDARLLVSRRGAPIAHQHVRDLPSLLRAGDLLVFNDTRVIPARLLGKKATGGNVETLLTRPLGGTRFVAMLRNAKGSKPGTRLSVSDALAVEVESNEGGGFYRVNLLCDDLWPALEAHGHIPLPPYIRRGDDASDRETYQTMFADKPGSAAAPTAGLHFTPELLQELTQRGISHTSLTLHVGPGTFLSVREEAKDDVRLHHMHAEIFELPQATVKAIAQTKASAGRVIAVGTTSCRTLESAAIWARAEEQVWGRVKGEAAGAQDGLLTPMSGESELFITPGFKFSVVDALITNFHLPQSTLLMLVSAFVGMERAQAIYTHAVAEKYRFFSYGDASLLFNV